jgi:hypothetical protein
MRVTFMDEHWKGGSSATEAATLGAGERLRPILMTACAMTVGMVPMALALEKGSEMQAPLGLAVIGGLVMSTFATLLVLPSVFAVVIGRRAYRSPSIYSDDRESRYYDPNVFAEAKREQVPEDSAVPGAQEVVSRYSNDEIMGYLRSMLHEMETRRHDMVTHHTVDDLLTPLGFTKSPSSTESSEAPNDDATHGHPDDWHDPAFPETDPERGNH